MDLGARGHGEMKSSNPTVEPTLEQLSAVIRAQTEIAKLDLDLNGVMTLVAERAQIVTGASGAA